MSKEPAAVTANDVENIMRKYDRESNTRIWSGWQKTAVDAVLAVFSLYIIYCALFAAMLDEVRLTSFVAGVLVMGYLTYPANKHHVRENYIPWFDFVLMALGAGAFFYFCFNANNIIMRLPALRTYEVVIGIIGIAALFELCRRCTGVPIMVVAGVFMAYAFYYYGIKKGQGLDAVKTLVCRLFYIKTGILSTPINACSNFIAVFIIFGAFLEASGISDLFIQLANAVAGSSVGGPAKVAVISSALCGMVSGSSVGNTVTTGSVTIPMMKKTGYKPEFAGAVEAAASTGGQIMPPIMGAAAFLMAEYMGLPYATVAVKAILPAVLYFTGIFIAVHLEAKKLGLKGLSRDEMPAWKDLGRKSYLLLPLILLVWLVSSGAKTMQFSAAVSILAAVVVGFLNKGERLTPKKIFEALEAGARGAITVGVACAVAGMIAGCITVTGLASILINGIVGLAGNAQIIGLALTMVCCIILGMGVPTTANYCIMASTCAPILIKMGIPVVAAHFFVFYFGIVADITPPVALAAYAGSAIAKSDPMKTAVNATKLAIAAFIVPYIFAYSPALLFENVSGWWEVTQICISALLGIFGIAAALNGHLYKKVPWYFRLLLVAGGLGMMIPGTLTDVAGLALVVLVIAVQYWSAKREKAITA